MKYIYGPIQSRRLGLSLGVSLLSGKICDFDCIYCQLGPTLQPAVKRAEFIPWEEVVQEVKLWLSANAQKAAELNFITLSGCGEPTLHSKIKEIIAGIKSLSACPLAIITNASLMKDAAVRQDLLQADLIVPSLDAATQKVFARIDRPQADIKIAEIIQGLISLRKEFRGKIWLEVMLVAGVNDDLRHIKRLKETIDEINPNKVQLNSPVRATSEQGVLPVERKKLERFKEILGTRCEII